MVDAVLLAGRRGRRRDAADRASCCGKALAHGLRPIVVVNKIDRPEQRAQAVVDEVFDLLVELGADDEQLDFPVVYASAKQGTAVARADAPRVDLRPLLDTILEQVRRRPRSTSRGRSSSRR